MKVDRTWKTTGKGLWSQHQKSVKVTHMELEHWMGGYDEWHGELRVYFDTSTWNTKEVGIIYTDPGFMGAMRAFLMGAGLAAFDCDYSESGMQGDDYVSCDAGHEFVKSWFAGCPEGVIRGR